MDSDSIFGAFSRSWDQVRRGEEGRTRNNAACAVYSIRTTQKILHLRSQTAYTRSADNTVDVLLSVGVDYKLNWYRTSNAEPIARTDYRVRLFRYRTSSPK